MEEEKTKTAHDLCPDNHPKNVTCVEKCHESEEEEEIPDVALKDLEEESLREMARERRRIIENQVVRRKVIEKWIAAEMEGPQTPEKSQGVYKKKSKLQVIQKHWHNMTAKLKSGTVKTTSAGQKNCSLKSEEEFVQRSGKYRMTSDLDLITFEAELNSNQKKISPPGDANNNPHLKSVDNTTTETANVLAPTEEALLVQINGGKICMNGNGINCEDVDDDSLVVNSTGDCPTDYVQDKSGDTPHDSLETQDEDFPVRSSCSEVIEETEILQTDNIKETVEITICAGESKTETITSNSSMAEISQNVMSKEVSFNKHNIGESVIEREIRLQKEREETLNFERQALMQKEGNNATKSLPLSALDEAVAVEEVEFRSECDAVDFIVQPKKAFPVDGKDEISQSQSKISTVAYQSEARSTELEIQSQKTYTSEVSGVVIQSKKVKSGENTESLSSLSSESKASVNSEVFRSTLMMADRVQTTGVISSAKQLRQERMANDHPTAESKIALEIREMREREEELKRMREEMASLNGNCISPDQSTGHSRSGSSVRSDDSQDMELPNGVESPQPHELNSKNFRDHKDIFRTVSLDSLNLGQSYNIGYVFAHRRKENIKVRPFTDEDDDKPNFKVLQESPVEREIRIAKEREEELRREKAMLLQEKHLASVEKKDLTSPLHVEINGNQSPQLNDRQDNSSPNKPKTVTKYAGDTQRQLATTRIQQEIEEQTRREKDLKASGHIQTTSQERTDGKVSILGAVSPASVCSNSTVITAVASMTNESPSPSPDIIEKASLSVTANGHGLAKANGSVRPSSSATSSSSSSCKPVGPVSRRLSNPPPGKNVNMQRFIASKGKEIAFSNGCTKTTTIGCFDYREIKPPQVRKGDTLTQKRSATAESKIQEELKEMKAREEELKKQRARLLGLSQPNLSILVTDEDLTINGNSEEPTAIERCSSNPNLLEADDATDASREQEVPVGGPRRRSVLIDQWEQRIQKADIKV